MNCSSFFLCFVLYFLAYILHQVKEELEAVVKCKQVHRIQEEVKTLLGDGGSERDFRALHIILYYASTEEGQTSMKLSQLHHLLGPETPTEKNRNDADEHGWRKLAKLIGFTIESYDGVPYVVYPNTTTCAGEGVVKSALLLVDSILDCFNGNWRRVPHLTLQHTHLLMKVIENHFAGKPTSLNDGKLKGLKSCTHSMELLRGCGFRECPGGALKFTGDSHSLMDVYVVVYFLTVGTSCHCCII